jgi:S-adenosylmethionine:tRNA ribosyltransferase-isomerase
VLTADFDYELPERLVAQVPASSREHSRLLLFHRAGERIQHSYFGKLLAHLQSGDLLILNDTKVFPARLRAVKVESAGRFEILLLRETGLNNWWAMMKPGKRARLHTEIRILDRQGRITSAVARVQEHNAEGHRRLHFFGVENIASQLEAWGEVPLPPYIKRPPGQDQSIDLDRYQTVYAREAGSVAAPTAGLHFSKNLFQALQNRGVEICFVTLHVGLGTFAPVKADRITDHVMHDEAFTISPSTVARIHAAKTEGRRVLAVGTTTVRVLESVAASPNGVLAPVTSRTRIFIHPPFTFRIVDGLITNFHLPRSTLLMLVSAFAAPGQVDVGRRRMLGAYAEAVRLKYRFFSYGDAMLIL